MGTKFLATAVATGLFLNAGTGAAQTAAPTSTPKAALAADSAFIQTTSSFGLLQVKLGKLAQEKGSSDAVRDYGKRMVDDYSKANEQLAAGAKQAAYPAPVLLRQHQQLYDRFSRMSRSSFDKNYMTEMVDENGEAVRLFQDESERGRVASLKQLASELLPMVQQHQSLATQTASTVGVDITASN